MVEQGIENPRVGGSIPSSATIRLSGAGRAKMPPMQPNPRKTTSFRDLGEVDIDALRERVLAIPEAVWDAENASKPNRFDALSSTRHIVFRFIRSPESWTVRTRWPRLLGTMLGILARYRHRQCRPKEHPALQAAIQDRPWKR